MNSFRAPRSKLSVLSLSAATFFMVSGGPYGLEELVQKTGYSGSVIILLLLPFVWDIPTGLLVGELAAAIPEEGGFYIWVRRAMGPFWGFQEAWLSLASSIFDMAAYPAVFVMSLGQLWPAAEHSYRIPISMAVIAGCMLWNLRGASAVGKGSVGLGSILLAPFVLLTVFSFGRGHAAGTTALAPEHLDWFGGILIAMWNSMGWDNASTVAREVQNPQKTYPRVMFTTLAAIMVVYIVPVLAARHAGIPARGWDTGSWVSTAAAVGGPWLGTFALIGAMISSTGILNSLTMSYSRIPLALAETGFAPKVLLKQLSNGAPWVSILCCGVAWMLALGLDFDRILLLDILLYGLSLILEFVALIVLRIREPQLVRPFRVPGGIAGAAAIGIGPTVLLAGAFIANRHEQVGSISAVTLALSLMVLGIVLYAVRRLR